VNAGNGYGNMYYLPKHAKLSKGNGEKTECRILSNSMKNSHAEANGYKKIY
jgi:hypothetical protein